MPRKRNHSLLKILLIIALIIIIIYLPVHAGYAKIPQKWTPQEVADLAKGVTKYWLETLQNIITKIQQLIHE